MTEAGALIRRDIADVQTLLKNWPTDAWEPLRSALAASAAKPVMLVGEGSSRLFPAALLRHLRRLWRAPVRFDDCGGREAEHFDLSGQTIVGLSNSGETREVVELLDRLIGEGHEAIQAILGRNDGYMATNVKHHIAVLDRPEEAVAATVSVIGQALVLAHALAAIQGTTIPTADLAKACEQLMTESFSDEASAVIQGAKRIFWCGADTGAAAELTLKTVEITRLPGIHAPGNLVLHGLEEIMDEGDVVVVMDLPEADMDLVQKFVIEGTPAKVLRLDTNNGNWPGITVPDCGEWTPITQLVAGWRLMLEIAAVLDVNPDTPQRARKVGNPRTEG